MRLTMNNAATTSSSTATEGQWVVKPYPFSSGSVAAEWLIGIKVQHGKGLTVAYSCTKELPDKKKIELQPISVPTNDTLSIGAKYWIPSNFDADIDLKYELGTAEQFHLSLIAYLIAQPGDPQYELSVPLDEFGPEWAGKRGISKGIQTMSKSEFAPPPPWNDLYVRTAVGEKSPNDRQGGFGSPDIMPIGTTPLVDPWSLLKNYDQYINNPIYGGLANIVYVRAKNSSDQSKAGKANLVMCNPGTVIWPDKNGWTRIKTQAGAYESTLSCPSGEGIPGAEIGLTYSDPFVYIPPPGESGHRCFVTWLDTEDHPLKTVPPQINTASELAAFLVSHPNYAHHNIDIVPSTTGSVTKGYPFSSGAAEDTWVIGVKVENVKGFKVGYSCATPIKGGKVILLAPTEVTTNDPVSFAGDYLIQADFNSNINITYETQGLTPANFKISLVAYLKVSLNHPLYHLATPFHEFGFTANASFGSDRGIMLGSMTMMRGSI